MLLFSLFLLPLLTNADEGPPPTTPLVTPPALCIKPGTCYGLPAACQPDTGRNCRVWMEFHVEQRTVSIHINSELEDGTFFALTADIPSVETKEYVICVPRGGRRLRGDASDGETIRIVEELPSDPDSIQTYFNRNFICTFHEDELPDLFSTRSNFFIAEGTPYSDQMILPPLTELLPIGQEDIWTNEQLEEEAWSLDESPEPLDHLEPLEEHQESNRMERRDLEGHQDQKWDCSQQGSCYGLPADCQPESDGNDCRVWVDLDEQHVRIHVNSEIHEETYFALSQGAESEGKDQEGKKKEYLICVPRAAKRLRGEAVDGEAVRIVDKMDGDELPIPERSINLGTSGLDNLLVVPRDEPAFDIDGRQAPQRNISPPPRGVEPGERVPQIAAQVFGQNQQNPVPGPPELPEFDDDDQGSSHEDDVGFRVQEGAPVGQEEEGEDQNAQEEEEDSREEPEDVDQRGWDVDRKRRRFDDDDDDYANVKRRRSV